MANDKWMLELNSVIGNIKLKDVILPGTHDSATFNCTNILAKPWTRCQSATILEQLESGIRFMDLRFAYRNDNYYAHHSVIECDTTVEEVVSDINTFFNNEEHSKEVLIIRISHLYFGELASKKEQKNREEELVKRIVLINGDINPFFAWRLQPRSVESATNQTVNDILNQGCRIVAIFDNINLDDNYIETNYPLWCNDNNDDASRICTMDQVWADTDSVTDMEYQLSQFQSEQSDEQSLFVLQTVLTPKSDLIQSVQNNNSTESIIPPSVYNLSKENNSTILAWISITAIHKRLNIIFMNFTTESYSTYNNKDLIDLVIDINKSRNPDAFMPELA